MQRRHFAVLTLLLAFLVSGRMPSLPIRAEAGEGASADFGTEQLVSILHRVNPTLSAAETGRIADAVLRYGDKYAIDPVLVTAVLLVESSARPWARSQKGALGLMQVMPHVVESNDVAGNLTTIESNVEAGCLILADNIRRLGERDGISAYFWGSRIRDASYFERVQEARAAVRRLAES